MQNVLKEVFKDYNNSNLENATIEKINLYKRSNKLTLDIISSNKIDIKDLESFEDYLRERFKIENIEIGISYVNAVDETIEKDWKNVERYISKRFPLINSILKSSKISVNDKKVKITIETKNAEFLYSYKIDKSIERLFNNLYGKSYTIVFEEDITEEAIKNQTEYLHKVQEQICKNVATEKAFFEEKIEREEKTEDTPKEYTPLIFGKSANIKEQVVKVADLNSDYGKIALEGKVIGTDTRVLKNGKTLVMFNLYDGTSTITCKAFVPPEKVDDVVKRIAESTRLKIQGNAQYDMYAKELGVIANVIVEVPAIAETTRKDNSEVKRVELHLHTQMSQMDAVTSATDLIKRAASWGMKSIAITDHGVVQAFPEAKKAADAVGIKVIYGVEAYFVPDEE